MNHELRQDQECQRAQRALGSEPVRTVMLRRGEQPPEGWFSHERPTTPAPGWQRTFDLVARHMLIQAQPAIQPDGRQRYRTPRGLRCAVGVLIPDGAYGGDLEGLSACDPFIAQQLWRRGHAPGLSSTLQDMHDNVPVAQWPCALRSIAEWYRLDDSVVDELEEQFEATLERFWAERNRSLLEAARHFTDSTRKAPSMVTRVIRRLRAALLS